MQDYCATNFLQPSGFRITISKNRTPYLAFMAQSIQHPAMDVPPVEIPFRRARQVPFTGESVEFGAVTMEVILDENMNVYGEIYNWLENAIETPHKLTQGVSYKTNSSQLSDYQDISVQILNSANNKTRSFAYRNAFPVTLGDINLAATNEETFITCPISFRFDYFEFL